MACGNGDNDKSLRMTLDYAWKKMLQMQSMINNVRTHTHPGPVALPWLLSTCTPPELALQDIHMMHLNEGGEFPRTQLAPYKHVQTQQESCTKQRKCAFKQMRQPVNVISICATTHTLPLVCASVSPPCLCPEDPA